MSSWDSNKLNYIHSCHLNAKVQVKIGTLEGEREKPNYKEILSNPLLKYSGIFEHNDLYATCEIYANNQSLCLPVKTSYKYMEKKWQWDEWLTLPLSVSDLPRNALLTLTVWDLHTSQEDVPVAGGTISLFDLDGELRQGTYELRLWRKRKADGNDQTSTPAILTETRVPLDEYPILNELDRLAKLSRNYSDGRMIKQEWLDKKTLDKMNKIIAEEKKNLNFFYLKLEFPVIKCDDVRYHVLYYEEEALNKSKFIDTRMSKDTCILNDFELEHDNIIEKQHIKLEHSKQMSFEMNLKPDIDNKQLLNKILNYPVTRALKQEEKQVLFKYRYYLSQNKKALTKVLQCFNLEFEFEGSKLMELLAKWQPMDVEDSLELLSSKYKDYPKIRSYAVSRLQSASDNDLVLYLLQLVQALRYENFTKSQSKPTNTEVDTLQSVFELNLKDFLIERAKRNEVIADCLYWFIKVEVGDNETQRTNFHIFMDDLIDALLNGGPQAKRIFDNIVKQEGFLKNLNNVVKIVQRESGNRDKKVIKLRQILNESSKNLLSFDEIPLVLDPDIKINGILVEKTTMFRSNLMPCKFVFRTAPGGGEYSVIYKIGDDLRQDQLVLQTIALMDKLLKQENLDLKLTPYKVIASGPKEGFISFVDAIPVSQILNDYRGIKEFLRKHNQSDTDRHGIRQECMDVYVRSSAGYIVITYLLGVGDRHCDNILISTSGRLFHIDFGYILGRDPKVLQPTVKLTKDMADGMGGRLNADGKENKEYEDFKKYCCNAFLHLRRHANLIINLFSLMVDANIPDIALEPDKTVKKIMDRFKLDVNDEEAVISLVKEIEGSYDSIVGNITDRIHNYNTALR